MLRMQCSDSRTSTFEDRPPPNGSYNGNAYYILINAILWGNWNVFLSSNVPDTSPPTSTRLILGPFHTSITLDAHKDLGHASYTNATGVWAFDCTRPSPVITIVGGDSPQPLVRCRTRWQPYLCRPRRS